MSKMFDPYNTIKPERIEFLTDGVFAIAMTLLVLDIRLPIVKSLRSEATYVRCWYLCCPKY